MFTGPNNQTTIMSTLLILISENDKHRALLNFSHRIAKAFEFEMLIATYNDSNLKLKKNIESEEGNAKITGSETDFTSTLHKSLDNSKFDVSLVIIPGGVTDFSRKRNTNRFFSSCKNLKIPYVLMPENIEETREPHNIFYPVCMRNGEKETSAWAGYWTRINQSNLTLTHPELKNKDNQKRLWLILVFIQRLFNKSNIQYKTLILGQTKRETINSTVALAASSKNSLLVIPATRVFSPEYYFFESPEFRILKNRASTPVLFVNPRHDLYVPCG